MHQFYKRFFCSLIVFVGIGLLVLKGYCFFYPVRQTESGKAVSESVPVGTKMESRLNADTEYICQKISVQDGTVTSERKVIPEQLVGMTRNDLASFLQSRQLSPSLSEREEGLCSVELTSFSSERVVISNYYRTPEQTGFYLVVKNHFVSVYKEDRKSCVQDTNILLGNLPDYLQKQIIDGKYVADQKALYDFLETYTS